MGWCSGTGIFDAVAKAVLAEGPVDKKAVLKQVWEAMEDSDWDCQNESEYYDHTVIQEIVHELHPDWFEDDGDADD